MKEKGRQCVQDQDDKPPLGAKADALKTEGGWKQLPKEGRTRVEARFVTS